MATPFEIDFMALTLCDFSFRVLAFRLFPVSFPMARSGSNLHRVICPLRTML